MSSVIEPEEEVDEFAAARRRRQSIARDVPVVEAISQVEPQDHGPQRHPEAESSAPQHSPLGGFRAASGSEVEERGTLDSGEAHFSERKAQRKEIYQRRSQLLVQHDRLRSGDPADARVAPQSPRAADREPLRAASPGPVSERANGKGRAEGDPE